MASNSQVGKALRDNALVLKALVVTNPDGIESLEVIAGLDYDQVEEQGLNEMQERVEAIIQTELGVEMLPSSGDIREEFRYDREQDAWVWGGIARCFWEVRLMLVDVTTVVPSK